jgi:phosphatidylethanolamine-binding protein (PEBP) family uncharacterized protein
MSGPMKDAIREKKSFASEVEDKDAVQMWLWSELKTFFAGWIRRIVKSLHQYVLENGN